MANVDANKTRRSSTELVEQTLLLWEMPLLFATAWWNGMLAPRRLLGLAAHHARRHLEESGQLVVPEPIEEEDEHALFA